MARPQSDRVAVRYRRDRQLRPWGIFWRAFNVETGKRERESLYFVSEAEARDQAAAVERELGEVRAWLRRNQPGAKPAQPATGPITFSMFAQTFIETHLPRRTAGSFVTHELNLRLHIEPIVGHLVLSPETFGADQVTAVAAALAKTGADWGQQRNVLKTMSAVLKWAAPPHGKLLPANPVRGMSEALADDNFEEPEPNPLTFEQQAAFLTWLETGTLPEGYEPRAPDGDRPVEGARREQWPAQSVEGGFVYYAPYFLVVIHTGLRRGEADALMWDCVFLEVEQPYVLIRRSYSERARRLARKGMKKYPADGIVNTKTKKHRKVELSDEAADALRALARTRRERGRWGEPSRFVFPHPLLTSRQVAASTVDRVLLAGMRAIGAAHEKHTVHSLRDTFATLHLERYTSIAWVSQMLGHSKISTTVNHYWKYVPPEREQQSPVGKLSRPAKEPAAATAGAPAPTTKGVGLSAERPRLREVPKPRRR